MGWGNCSSVALVFTNVRYKEFVTSSTSKGNHVCRHKIQHVQLTKLVLSVEALMDPEGMATIIKYFQVIKFYLKHLSCF